MHKIMLLRCMCSSYIFHTHSCCVIVSKCSHLKLGPPCGGFAKISDLLEVELLERDGGYSGCCAKGTNTVLLELYSIPESWSSQRLLFRVHGLCSSPAHLAMSPPCLSLIHSCHCVCRTGLCHVLEPQKYALNRPWFLVFCCISK